MRGGKIEEVDYANVGSVAVKARIYSLEQDNKIYKVTVADFSRTGLDQIAILDLAVNIVTRDVAIKMNLRRRYNLADICREISFVAPHGSHSTVTSVYYQRKLYQIQGTVLPPNPDSVPG